jgi:hypothetical protein
MVECSPTCGCGDRCANKVSQGGVRCVFLQFDTMLSRIRIPSLAATTEYFPLPIFQLTLVSTTFRWMLTLFKYSPDNSTETRSRFRHSLHAISHFNSHIGHTTLCSSSASERHFHLPLRWRIPFHPPSPKPMVPASLSVVRHILIR